MFTSRFLDTVIISFYRDNISLLADILLLSVSCSFLRSRLVGGM